MAALVAVNTSGRIATLASLSAIKVTITANSVSYATSLGGLAVDLFAALQTAGPMNAMPNSGDIFGILPLGVSSVVAGFIPLALTVGTQTTTALPCYVRLYGVGTAGTAAGGNGIVEMADGATTAVFSALVLLARGGTN